MSTTPTVSRIMLVEDHALVRSAVRQAISARDLEVVGEAGTAEDAIPMALELKPDIVLIDIDLPGMSGIELVRELTSRLPDSKLIMLTVSSARRDLFDAIRQGASGYLTKDMTPEALVRSIRGARTGDLPMPRRLAAEVIGELARARPAPSGAGAYGLDRLTSRETEVLRMISSGMTDREAADSLGISVRTVETHVSNLLHKLGVRNRAEASRLYRERT
jgi:two-component system, NarL family, nitrate/nitrite response regulator NarL